MVAVFYRSRTSTGVATLVGAVTGLAAVGVYLGAGLLVAVWSISEFFAHLSVSSIGYFLGMIALTVAVFGIPAATLLRFNLTAPLVVLVSVVLVWLTIGAVQSMLSSLTVFGLALYVATLSPLYLVLYSVVGAVEYLVRRRATSP